MYGDPPAFTPEEFAAVRGMIRAGLTRGEVARRFGVSRQTVGAWLQGKVQLAARQEREKETQTEKETDEHGS